MKLKVYLCHPWRLRHEAQAIVDYIQKHVDVEFVNPFNHPFTKQWRKGDTSRKLAWKIVEKDLKWIMASDILVAIYPEEGIGSPQEVWFASKEKGKISIVLTQYVNHPWLQFCGAITVRTREELLVAIKRIAEELECA